MPSSCQTELIENFPDQPPPMPRPRQTDQHILALQGFLSNSEPFSRLTFNQIPMNGRRQKPLGNNQTKPRQSQSVFPDLNLNGGLFETFSGCQQSGNITPAETLIAAIPEMPAQTVGLYRKPGPTLGPASPNHRPATTGLHANKKAVRTFALHN